MFGRLLLSMFGVEFSVGAGSTRFDSPQDSSMDELNDMSEAWNDPLSG